MITADFAAPPQDSNNQARTNEPVELTLVPSPEQMLPSGFSDVRFNFAEPVTTSAGQKAIKKARATVAKIVAATSPLAALRLRCSLSQEQLHAICGTAQSTISKAESGENINQLTIEQIAQGLNKPVPTVYKAYLATRRVYLKSSA